MGLRRALRIVDNMPQNHLPVPGIASPWTTESHLATIVWSDIFGTLETLPMNRAEAMAVPAIAKARHVVAPKVASTPLRVLAGDTLLPEQPTWLTRTDDEAEGVSPWHRMLWTVDDIIFHGWSLWLASRGAAGQLLAATRVAFERWEFTDDGRIKVDGAETPMPKGSVILIPGPHEGILNFGRVGIRHARQLLDNASRAGKMPTANIELHQTSGEPLTADERTELIEAWAAARAGDNAGVAYTSPNIETKEHGSIDAQLLIEGRNAAAVEVARLVGVAAGMVDATVPKASLNYETQQGRGLEHTEYGIEPYADAIAARLSLDDVVPRGQRVRFDITQDTGPVQPTGPTVED